MRDNSFTGGLLSALGVGNNPADLMGSVQPPVQNPSPTGVNGLFQNPVFLNALSRFGQRLATPTMPGQASGFAQALGGLAPDIIEGQQQQQLAQQETAKQQLAALLTAAQIQQLGAQTAKTTAETDLLPQEAELSQRRLDIQERDLIRKEGVQKLRENLLQQFTSGDRRSEVVDTTSPFKSSNNLDDILSQAESKINQAANFAIATGDDSLLKAAKAQYEVALDKYNRKSGKDIKDAEFNAAGFYERMNAAEDNLSKIQGGLPTIGPEIVSASLGEGLANIARTPEQQLYVREANDWIRAKLRKESGAVIGPEEMADEFRTYFPMIGDDPSVVEAKRKARQLATENMGLAGGRVLRMTPQINAASGQGITFLGFE